LPRLWRALAPRPRPCNRFIGPGCRRDARVVWVFLAGAVDLGL